MNSRSSKGGLDDHKVDHRVHDCNLVEILKSVKTYFSESTNVKTFRLTVQPLQYNRHISGVIAKWGNVKDLLMKFVVFKAANTTRLFLFLYGSRPAYEGSTIHDQAAAQILSHFVT